MMKYVQILGTLKEDIDLYLMVLLTIILISSVIDWLFGWVNAKFNQEVNFESSIALYGIIKKMMYFLVLILFTISSLAIIPHEVSLPAITALYIGYFISEVNSILSHLDLTEDGKEGSLFKDYLMKIFVKGGKK